jgi:hypothetical protein
MNRALIFPVLLSAAFAVAPLIAAPKSKTAAPIVSPIEPPTAPQSLSPKEPRLIEFQEDPIDLVLRTLARQAKMNLVVSEDAVTTGGTVTMRVEDKSPAEAMALIVESKGLLMEKGKNGVYFVRSKNPPPSGASKEADKGKPEKSMEEALGGLITPAVFGFYDSLLDYQAKPETAQKIAKSKKVLYDALVAEGFSKEEAFRLILPNQEFSLPDLNK